MALLRNNNNNKTTTPTTATPTTATQGHTFVFLTTARILVL